MNRFRKVYLEISNICNLRCSFCPGTKRKPHIMNEAEFTTIAEKLRPYTDFLYFHLMGEPLCHPELAQFLEIAGGLGFKVILTTNGTLLSKHQQMLINAPALHKVNISLHSFENGTNEDYIQYIQNIAGFAKAAASAGTIAVFRLWNKGYDNGKNDFALKVLQEQIPGDWSPNTRGIRVRDKIFIEMDDRFEWPDSNADIKGTQFYCYGLKDQFGILADGTVVPCCLDSDGVINLGNVFQEDLSRILSSERAQALRDGFRCGKASEELCRRCGFAQRFVR